jgi:hypothetical protein
VTQREAKEVVDKAEEEQRKKDEEARNSETVPMDTDLPEIFTTCTSGQSQIGGLDLGFEPHLKQAEVPNLKKFTYDKASGKIMQEQVKKVPTMGGDPISVVTQTPVTRDVREYLIHSLHWLYLHECHRRQCLKLVPTESREGSKD